VRINIGGQALVAISFFHGSAATALSASTLPEMAPFGRVCFTKESICERIGSRVVILQQEGRA